MCRKPRQRQDFSQSGLTLIELLLTMAITGLIVSGIAAFGVKFFQMRENQQIQSRNHFNFSPLVEAFYRDVHSGSGMISDQGDSAAFILKKAEGNGFIYYRIASASIQRGESSGEGFLPITWKDLTNSSQFMVQSGSFSYYGAKNSPATSSAAVRRIDLRNLILRQVRTKDTDTLSLLSAYLMSANPPAPMSGTYAILAGGDLQFTGHPIVNSAPPGKGHVHANQDVDMSGSSHISGRVEAGGELQQSGKHSGEEEDHAAAVNIPMYSPSQVQALADAAKAGGTTMIAHGFSGGTLRGYFRSSVQDYDILNPGNSSGGTLKFTGNSDLTFEGTVFVEGRLDISGDFRLTGHGRLICTEPIVIGGHAKLLGDDGSSFALVTLSNQSTAVKADGSTMITGIVFAPNGGAAFSGTPLINGSIILGGSGQFSGTPTVNYTASQTWSLLGSSW